MTEVPKTTVSMYLKVALLALPWVSVQMIWNTCFGVITNSMESLGLPKSDSKMIWIFGPITGFFTAPIVGAYSDACTSKYGRRRPYIVAGLLTTVICAMVFAFSKDLPQSLRVPIGYISFVCLDITINVLQTPLRALGSDLAPPHMQATVQLLAAFFQGVGGILASYISKALYFGNLEDLPAVFGIVMGANLVIISFVCFTVKEEQHVREGAALKLSEPFTSVVQNVAKMDAKLLTVCMTNFFSWAALFTWWPNAANWWGVYVYGGCISSDSCPKDSPLNKKFQEGTTAYGDSGIWANLVQTSLCVILSLVVLRGILRRVKFIYAFSLAVGAAFLILVKLGPRSITFAYMVAICVAIPISAIQSFPFAIVGSYNTSKKGLETGVQFGILNLFITVPQLIVTLVIANVTDFEWALFGAGVCFGIAALLALFIYEVPANEQVADIEKK
jgi:hypothetical protein